MLKDVLLNFFKEDLNPQNTVALLEALKAGTATVGPQIKRNVSVVFFKKFELYVEQVEGPLGNNFIQRWEAVFCRCVWK